MNLMTLTGLLVAALAGVAMAVQGSMNTVMGKVIGILEATLVVHVIGVLVALFAVFGLRLGEGSLGALGKVPYYLYLGGALGVIIVLGVVFSMARAGVANATTAIIIGQVATAVLIDYLGLFGLEKLPFSWWKGLGLVLLAAGGYFMLYR